MDIPVGHDHGSELQVHAEILERDRHRCEARARLHNRKGELAACQETGFLAIHRNQIGLGENLQQTLVLESFNDGAEVNVWTEKKKIEDVVDGGGGRGGCGCRSTRGQRLRPEGTVLSRGYGADGIRASSRNEVN